VTFGLDIGTTSAKVAAFDADGEMSERREHEYGPDADVEAIVDAALDLLPDGLVGLSSAMHALVGLDERDRPCTPLLKWSDLHAIEQAERIKREHPELHARTGTPIHPMSPLTKLAWFADEGVTARRWVGLKELVVHRLTGEWVTDHSVASGTGLMALETLEWDELALDVAGITADQLPRLVPTTERFGDMVIGAGDGPLANLGLGATTPGIAACSIGTSGALRVTVAEARVTEQTFCYALTPGRWVVGGAINNGGNVLEWLGDLFGADIETLLEEAEGGSEGLVMQPYLRSERAPHWDARLRGSYENLTHEHRRGHFVRAALEGVCHQLRLVLDSLTDAGYEVGEVRATGGFVRSELWKQILADTLGVPVTYTGQREGSALGAAMLAREAFSR
jgi:gluconokinase